MSKKKSLLILIGILTFMGVSAYLGWHFMEQYETAIMDVYAEQQDQYVQLVLDQINVQKKNTEQQMIQDIIGTLDSGKNQYWTLSDKDTLLFVKNITESNHYRGVSSETFYVTKTANAFFESLSLNRVTHKVIQIEDDVYVASGVAFIFQGSQYKICLLSDETVILDNNKLLSARVVLGIYLLCLLTLMFVMFLVTSTKVVKKEDEIFYLKNRELELHKMMFELQEKLKETNAYSTRWNLYSYRLMDAFVEKLGKRNPERCTFVKLEFNNEKERKDFLMNAQLVLDDKMIRFATDSLDIYLIMMGLDDRTSRVALKRAGDVVSRETVIVEHNSSIRTLGESYAEFKEVLHEQ